MRTLPLLLLVAPLLAPCGTQAVSVWTATSVEKIRPSAAARLSPSAHVSAARNELEAVQIAITGLASNVSATATDLSGAGGTIPAPRLYREALLDLANRSGLDGATGRWPDGLVPDTDEFFGEKRNAFPFSVPAGETRALWAEVLVPESAAPGDYAGSVRVRWDGGEATVPFTVTVWPFTLPAKPSLRTAFGFSWGAIPSGHGFQVGDAFYQLRARYGVFALDHRITLSHIDDSSTSLDHFASTYGPSIDGTAATRLAGASLTAVELMGDASAWASAFRAHGWLDRLFQYTCDEPPITCAWSDIPARARAAKAADPSFRTLVTTTIQEADANGVTSSIDIMVPVINFLDDKPGSQLEGDQRPKYDAFLAGSPLRELWAYQSCMSHGCAGSVNFGNPSASDYYYTGWPSYSIDTTAVRNRAMQWLLFEHRLSGELYYETTQAYAQDAWTNQWAFGGNGDGTLFYPGTPAKIGGTTHVPVASMRLKLIRDGMEDYEYLALLARSGGEAEARAIARALFPHPYETSASPEALLAAREQVARRIIALVAPGSGSGGGSGSGDTGPAPPGGSAKGCAVGGTAGALSLLALAVLARRRRRS
ncbi:MAG TPA: glycoside hydrolase domain-containing protein [Anaeromyxobacter sp.]